MQEGMVLQISVCFSKEDQPLLYVISNLHSSFTVFYGIQSDNRYYHSYFREAESRLRKVSFIWPRSQSELESELKLKAKSAVLFP